MFTIQFFCLFFKKYRFPILIKIWLILSKHFLNHVLLKTDRKSTRLNSSHVSISLSLTLSLHDALPIYSYLSFQLEIHVETMKFLISFLNQTQLISDYVYDTVFLLVFQKVPLPYPHQNLAHSQ